MANATVGDRRKITNEQATDLLIEGLQAGLTVEQALAKATRSRSWYEANRRKDPFFKNRVDLVRELKKDRNPVDRVALAGSYQEFSERFLGTRVFPHSQNVVDIIEGRDPSWVHDSFIFEKGTSGHRRLLVNLPPNFAKALALDTVVPTPHGWSTIGDLRVGDVVWGPDGKPTTVVGKSVVFHKLVSRVVVSSGESFTASDDHLWTVSDGGRGGLSSARTVTTRELVPGMVLPPVAELHQDAVEFELDPYLLGCWLGDGHSSSGQLTSADPEIVEAFRAAFPGVSTVAGKTRAVRVNVPGLFPHLSRLGVKGKKFVPEGYLHASAEQRLALLQGLMDTDGTISAVGYASFTNTNRDLSEAVLFLAASLGLRPTIREERATLNGADAGPVWRVGFTPHGVPVFRLPRKLARISPVQDGTQGGPRLRRIVSVEPAELVPTQCITVDNDSHLFLIGKSLVPTHNSMTVTIGYATYRICRDPNVRIIVVSKTQALARKFLGAIQSRLTHPNYKDLQLAFGPQDGFKATADQWSADRMFLGGEVRDPQEKDPTVEALGFGSQIYGARADLIILDDVVTLSNAAEYEKQMDWIRQEVASRLGPGGVLLVIGTRVAPVDLYRELRNPDHYTDGRSPWTYLAMPAVLDTGTGDPETWTTLWPKSDRPFDEGDEVDEDGLFDRWTGERLHTVRNEVGPNKWSMVYQQLDVSEDATFDPIAVRGCVNGFRKPGPLHPGAPGYPVDTDGFYTICSLDPAMSGGVAACAYAVDRVSKKRYVLDIRVLPGATTPQLQSLVHEFADKFRPQEFVIETNAMNLYVYQDPVITDYLRARGIVLKPHYTGNNKVDPNLGVASMGPLFGTVSQRGDGRGVKHDGNGLIELPDQNYPGIKSLIEQLVTWVPNKRGSKLKQDAVMAMWFCETRAREVIMSASSDQWFTAGGGFTSQRDMERRQVIALDEWAGHNPVVFL